MDKTYLIQYISYPPPYDYVFIYEIFSEDDLQPYINLANECGYDAGISTTRGDNIIIKVQRKDSAKGVNNYEICGKSG